MQETASLAQDSTDGRSILSLPRRILDKTPRQLVSSVIRRMTSYRADPAHQVQHTSLVETPVEEEKPRHIFRPILDTLTGEMLHLNDFAARKQGVESAVHPKDFIYWFCASHPLMSLEEGITYYFQNGGSSAGKLAEIVAELGFGSDQSLRLLEFASGYGCVSRHLKKNPGFDLVSSDIHSEATEFISDRLGVRTMLSVPVPEEFSPADKYDVVFALSFFSHMPKSSFGRWLRALFNALKSPGYLVFTTHGLKSIVGLEITADDIPADGYWFNARSEQKDLDTAEYGLSLTTADCVIGEIYRHLGAAIAMYRHAHWWSHQDLWVVKRER